MARKKKSSYLKKLLIFTLPLILIQSAVLFRYKSQNKAVSFKDAMNEAVGSNEEIEPGKQSLIKIHLALNDYRVKQGNFPDALDDLIPEYFDKVPIDPSTAEPYKYAINEEGQSFTLGQDSGSTAQDPDKPTDDSSSAEQTSIDEEEALLASLNNFEEQIFVYDPSGKRDPFRSFDFDKYNKRRAGATPLEQFDYGEFRISAILLDSGEPKAIIEDGIGKGHTVNINTKIGLYGGVIHEIKEDRIVVKETTIDIAGEQSTKLIDIYLPVVESDFGSLSREESIGTEEGKAKN